MSADKHFFISASANNLDAYLSSGVILIDLVNRLKLIAPIMEGLWKEVAFPKRINFNRSFAPTKEGPIQFKIETWKQLMRKMTFPAQQMILNTS